MFVVHLLCITVFMLSFSALLKISNKTLWQLICKRGVLLNINENNLKKLKKSLINTINMMSIVDIQDPYTKLSILARSIAHETGLPDDTVSMAFKLHEAHQRLKESEEALRTQNKTLSQVLNSLDDLVYVVDMKTYEIIFINTYGQNIFGDINGKICWQTIQTGPSSPCEFCTNSQLIGPDGKPTEGVVWEFQNTVTKRWYDCRDRAIYWPDGRIVRMEIATDITERKQAEEFLRQAEQKYRSIFENAVEGIFQTTLEGQYISVNPALARMIGYDTPEESIKGVIDLSKQGYVNPEDRVRYKKTLEEQGIIQVFETQHYRKDGSIIWVSINARAVKDEAGKILYYEGTIEDITSRKLAEEELKHTLEKLRKSLAGTIQAISLTVEIRDPYTAGHQKKVSILAHSIAHEMGLSDDTVDIIRMAGSIHDIGKISVPVEILVKPGKLSDIEFSLIKVHPRSGYDILKDVGLIYPIAEIVLQHHERQDGSGYPDGLSGNDILIESRIIAVADVVEAITSDRPYRRGFGINVALKEIEKNKGILYDEKATEACLQLFREKEFSFE